MSYFNPNTAPDVVPVQSLEFGQRFSKSSFGAPRPQILILVAIYDDVAEAETLDGSTRTMNIRTLVHKL